MATHPRRSRRLWQDLDGDVHLREIDPITGAEIEHIYWVPNPRGYVRDRSAQDRQVCVGLSTRGPTLESSRRFLLDLIRREWRTVQRHREEERNGVA